jgi:hypothetical protein
MKWKNKTVESACLVDEALFPLMWGDQVQEVTQDKTTEVFSSVENIRGEKSSLLYPHSLHERIPATTGKPVAHQLHHRTKKHAYICLHILPSPMMFHKGCRMIANASSEVVVSTQASFRRTREEGHHVV